MKNDSSYVFSVARGKLREKAVQLNVERYLEVGFFKKDEQDPYQADAVYITSQSIHTE